MPDGNAVGWSPDKTSTPGSFTTTIRAVWRLSLRSALGISEDSSFSSGMGAQYSFSTFFSCGRLIGLELYDVVSNGCMCEDRCLVVYLQEVVHSRLDASIDIALLRESSKRHDRRLVADLANQSA